MKLKLLIGLLGLLVLLTPSAFSGYSKLHTTVAIETVATEFSEICKEGKEIICDLDKIMEKHYLDSEDYNFMPDIERQCFRACKKEDLEYNSVEYIIGGCSITAKSNCYCNEEGSNVQIKVK